jgi:DnaJ-class molecular chaperone
VLFKSCSACNGLGHNRSRIGIYAVMRSKCLACAGVGRLNVVVLEWVDRGKTQSVSCETA